MGTARFLLAALLLAGCATTPTPGATLVGAWAVESIGGASPVGPAPLTVEFDETNRVFGSSGCNRYTGAYSHEAATGALTVTPLGVTRRACIDPALMAQEQRMIDALQRANRVAERDGGVTLAAAGADIVLRRRASDARRARPARSKEAPAVTTAAAPIAPEPTPSSGAPLTPLRPAPASTSTYGLAGGPGATAPTSTAPTYTPPPAMSTPMVAPAAVAAPATSPAPVAAGRVSASGTLSLPEGAAPPPAAVVRVQLRDVSRVGAPATVIGQQEFPARAAPYAFAVEAPTSVIGPNARLTLVAQVLAGERLLFITDTDNPVSASGANGLNLRLAAAARAPTTAAAVRPAPIVPAAAAPIALPPAAAPPSTTVTPFAAPSAPTPVAVPAPAEIAGASPYQCRGETFRIAFEDHVAFLTTADGAVARLARIDASDDPGAPRMYSNSILTVLREASSGAVRFARGRAALTTCTAG